MDKKEVSKEMEEKLLDDLQFNSGKIIGSMCTSPNPFANARATLQTTLAGTRSVGSALAVWALLQHFRREGYRNIVRNCMNLTKKFAVEVQCVPGLDLVAEPETNVVGIEATNLQVGRIALELRKRG